MSAQGSKKGVHVQRISTNEWIAEGRKQTEKARPQSKKAPVHGKASARAAEKEETASRPCRSHQEVEEKREAEKTVGEKPRSKYAPVLENASDWAAEKEDAPSRPCRRHQEPQPQPQQGREGDVQVSSPAQQTPPMPEKGPDPGVECPPAVPAQTAADSELGEGHESAVSSSSAKASSEAGNTMVTAESPPSTASASGSSAVSSSSNPPVSATTEKAEPPAGSSLSSSSGPAEGAAVQASESTTQSFFGSFSLESLSAAPWYPSSNSAATAVAPTSVAPPPSMASSSWSPPSTAAPAGASSSQHVDFSQFECEPEMYDGNSFDEDLEAEMDLWEMVEEFTEWVPNSPRTPVLRDASQSKEFPALSPEDQALLQEVEELVHQVRQQGRDGEEPLARLFPLTLELHPLQTHPAAVDTLLQALDVCCTVAQQVDLVEMRDYIMMGMSMQLEMLYSLRRFKAAQQVLGFLCTYLLPNLISVDMNGYALAPRDHLIIDEKVLMQPPDSVFQLGLRYREYIIVTNICEDLPVATRRIQECFESFPGTSLLPKIFEVQSAQQFVNKVHLAALEKAPKMDTVYQHLQYMGPWEHFLATELIRLTRLPVPPMEEVPTS